MSITYTDSPTGSTTLSGSVAEKYIPGYAALIMGESGLVSYWRLGEASGNALDSKDTNPGTVHGGITRNVSGLLYNDPNGAIQSDGASGSYISIADNANLRGMAALSVEAWVKPTSLPYSTIWYGRYLIGITSSWVRFTVLDTHPTWIDLYSTGITLSAGQVYHIVGTYSSSGTMKIYVNGFDVSGTPSATPSASVDNGSGVTSYLGADGSASSYGFPGIIDEVAIYNTALTESQVKAHYLVGNGPYNDVVWGAILLNGWVTHQIAEVADDFEEGTLDFGKWVFWSGDETQAYLQDGHLVFKSTDVGVKYPGIITYGYQFNDGDVLRVETWLNSGDDAGTSFDLGFQSNSAYYEIYLDYGDLWFYGGGGAVNTSIPYDPVAHRWIGFRRDGTTIHFETSPDGATYTSQAELTDVDFIVNDPYSVMLDAWFNDGYIAPGQEVYFDNLNIPPAVYTDTVSGALGLDGSAIEGHGFMDVPSAGVLSLAGSATEALSHADSRIGAIPVRGQASDASSRAESISGRIRIDGSTSDNRVYPDVVSGQILIDGSATENRGYRDHASGLVDLTGYLTDAWETTAEIEGVLPIVGRVQESWGHIFEDTASGSISISGYAVEYPLDKVPGPPIPAGYKAIARTGSVQKPKTGILVGEDN